MLTRVSMVLTKPKFMKTMWTDISIIRPVLTMRSVFSMTTLLPMLTPETAEAMVAVATAAVATVAVATVVVETTSRLLQQYLFSKVMRLQDPMEDCSQARHVSNVRAVATTQIFVRSPLVLLPQFSSSKPVLHQLSKVTMVASPSTSPKSVLPLLQHSPMSGKVSLAACSFSIRDLLLIHTTTVSC